MIEEKLKINNQLEKKNDKNIRKELVKTRRPYNKRTPKALEKIIIENSINNEKNIEELKNAIKIEILKSEKNTLKTTQNKKVNELKITNKLKETKSAKIQENIENKNEKMQEKLETKNVKTAKKIETKSAKTQENIENKNEKMQEKLETKNVKTAKKIETKSVKTQGNIENKNEKMQEKLETKNVKTAKKIETKSAKTQENIKNKNVKKQENLEKNNKPIVVNSISKIDELLRIGLDKPNAKSYVEEQNNIEETKNIRATRRRKKEEIFKKPTLKIIPLGGIHEIGKNITVFEYEDEIIVVDCGLSFPEDDMLGVDLVIPDITYLEKNVEKIKGLVITHGHEDHIGAVPYLLKKINIPIYATKLPAGLIKNKLVEHKLNRSTKLNRVNQGDIISLGKNFKVEFIRSSHSIPDSVMLAIKTPAGTILHTGDFKVDYTPIDGKIMDFGRIAELGNQGILALMADSTNAERKGFTMSESSVGEVFDKLFLNCTKRIVVATFASNVHRVQQIVNSAIKYKRKIAVCGRSMINMIETARDLGYIECPKNIFIDIDMIDNYTDENLVIITTGSQGEPMSALTRMAAGDHRKVTITPNDLVIISATPIPGNEKFVSKVIDDLMQIGAEVVYSSLEAIHVSGHACQEEQKLIMALAKPKYFIPVHGEYRQLIAHGETAQSMGIDKDHVIMLANGRVLEINEENAQLTSTVQCGRVLVDGLGIGDVGSIVLKDRQHLSQDGLIVIVLTMDSETGAVLAGPDVISRGFVYVRESENLMDDVKSVVRHEIKKCEERGIRDWGKIKSAARECLRDYIFLKTKRNPMIIPIIMEV